MMQQRRLHAAVESAAEQLSAVLEATATAEPACTPNCYS